MVTNQCVYKYTVPWHCNNLILFYYINIHYIYYYPIWISVYCPSYVGYLFVNELSFISCLPKQSNVYYSIPTIQITQTLLDMEDQVCYKPKLQLSYYQGLRKQRIGFIGENVDKHRQYIDEL